MARVMVVDDDAGLRRLLRTILETEGHDVVEADNGARALAIVEQLRSEGNLPDLVLLDLMMPELDGWGFIVELHARDLRHLVRVIICSALHDEVTVLRGRQMGALGHVAKPFDAEVLVEVVEQALTESPAEQLERHGRVGDLVELIQDLAHVSG